ncbi:MAG: MFS transporter [bacterium]
MNEKEVNRNVRLYKLYAVLGEPILWGPTMILFIQRIGKMSLSEIYLMEAIVVGGIVLLEIPSGALADIIGRKKTMLLAQLFIFTSAILFAFINSPFDVWVSNILCMTGFACRSGADSAFLYDSLKEVNREAEYKKIEGSSMGGGLLAYAISSLFVGFLSEIDLRLPFILTIPWILFSCIVVFCFKEPISIERYVFKQQINLMKTSILFVANHGAVKWIICFTAMIAVSSKLWFFAYNPYFELVELELRYYGIVFFLLNIVAWFFSYNAHRVEKRIGEQACIIGIVVLVGLPILLMGSIVSQVMVSMVLFQNVVRGFMIPFFGDFINRYLDTKNRATVISIESAVSGFVSVISLFLFSFVLKIWSLTFSLQVLGIIVFLLGIITIIQYRRIFK